MTKNTLPTYAIVELLIRLSHIDPFIGDYKGHAVYDDGVLVKTTGGTITFSKALIKQQFDAPDQITDAELKVIAQLFTTAKPR
ncbi:hypothetical protein KXQ82_12515 [Mucilaginibacter sp. HMF5004]|uniref:hypothetical protein n=1 Tax=Mucilaginibacter rivuli TaxID=2857527 RepID=UPI001C5F4731|nr:hypothetical protein [Mucilaginibacter rivuli]MBW4890551.1 hypothetical protein [Mucilaginibacter rivuli]